MLHLILGGARSGKSNFGLQQALALSQQTSRNVTYVATGTATDAEMSARIARHQQERPDHWNLAEVPLELMEFITLQNLSTNTHPILLIDCLTLWLNNHLYHRPAQDFTLLFDTLTQALSASNADIFIIANEVGLGIIPMGELTRHFVDQAGWLNQAVAKAADSVTFVAAGLPMPLKRP